MDGAMEIDWGPIPQRVLQGQCSNDDMNFIINHAQEVAQWPAHLVSRVYNMMEAVSMANQDMDIKMEEEVLPMELQRMSQEDDASQMFMEAIHYQEAVKVEPDEPMAPDGAQEPVPEAGYHGQPQSGQWTKLLDSMRCPWRKAPC